MEIEVEDEVTMWGGMRMSMERDKDDDYGGGVGVEDDKATLWREMRTDIY